MSSLTCRAVVLLALCSAAPFPSSAAELSDHPATGSCSVNPTWVGCRMCCDIDAQIAAVLGPACESASIMAGGSVGGAIGSGIGGFIGGLICEVMMHDANCYDRCIGKDGDPQPISCSGSWDPDEQGVCRQVCEQGQHNVGPGTCPTSFSLNMTCCVDEYDPPGETECLPELCPGAACPPDCEPDQFFTEPGSAPASSDSLPSTKATESSFSSFGSSPPRNSTTGRFFRPSPKTISST